MNKVASNFVLAAVLVTLTAACTSTRPVEKQKTAINFSNVHYTIDGTAVRFTNGVSEAESAPGSASKIFTRYFGKELAKDINGDGRKDSVFVVTQTTGGSGTFYYLLAAINLEGGFTGSQGFWFGDRIEPQTIESGPGHSIILRYTDRAPDEPLTIRPSINKSVRLSFDSKTMRFRETNVDGQDVK